MLSCIYRCYVHVTYKGSDAEVHMRQPAAENLHMRRPAAARGRRRTRQQGEPAHAADSLADEQHAERSDTLQRPRIHTTRRETLQQHTAVASGKLKHCNSKRWHLVTAEALSSGRPGTTDARQIAAEHSLRQNAETAENTRESAT